MPTNSCSALAFALLVLASGVASAQTKAPAQSRSAASLECSRQADEKGLHGKARKKFRSKCLKEMKKKSS
jgi:hypothetical protein